MTPQQLRKIAENYTNENTLPDANFTQLDLIKCILQAIELAEKEPHWSYQINWLIVIAACARAIELNYGKFAESNTGIPWQALGEMVQHFQLRYKPTHGLGGHIFSEGSCQNLNLHRETINAVIQEDLPHLKTAFTQLNRSKFFRQTLPIATKLQKICNFYTEKSQLKLLREISTLLSQIKHSTSEERIFILRQIAIMGEAFVQLSDKTKANFDEDFVKACKNIRDTLDHAEAVFNTQERDQRIRDLLNEIDEYIETGNKQSNLKKYLWYIFRPFALTVTRQFAQQLLEDNYGYHIKELTIYSYQIPNHETSAGLYKPKRSSTPLYTQKVEKSKLPSPSLILKEIYLIDHLQGNNQPPSPEDSISKIQYLFQNRKKYEETEKIASTIRSTEEREFLSLYESFQKSLIQIKKTERKNKIGDVVKVDIFYSGILNYRTKESQIENAEGIEERWHYLYLFQSIYSQAKKKTALSPEEQELIEHYKSVESSYKKKIWDLCNPLLIIDGKPRIIPNPPKIDAQQKRKFLQAFLELYHTKYILLDQFFNESWHNLTDDTLNNGQLDFLKFYGNIQQKHSTIKIVPKSFSSNRYKQMEQAYQIIKHLIIAIEEVVKIKQKIEELIAPINYIDQDTLQTLNTYPQGINLLKEIGGNQFILSKITNQEIKIFSKFLNNQTEDVKKAIHNIKRLEFQRKKENLKAARINRRNPSYSPHIHIVEDTNEEKQKINLQNKIYHSVREYNQIIAGSYVRALKENSVFM